MVQYSTSSMTKVNGVDSDGYNLIVLGLPEDNALVVETLLSTPISYENKGETCTGGSRRYSYEYLFG